MVLQFYKKNLIFRISDYNLFLLPSHCHLDVDPVLIYQFSNEVLHTLVYHSLISGKCLILFVSEYMSLLGLSI